MKWGEGFKIRNWDDAWKAVLTVAIVITIIFMLVDFINWRTALDIIKKDLPIRYKITHYTLLQGYGYVPLLWRGDFTKFFLTDYRDPIGDLHDYAILQFKGHNLIRLNVDSVGDGTFIGEWSQSEWAKEYIKQQNEGWEKIAQPFGDYMEIVIKVKGNKVLVAVFGEERMFLREFNCQVGGGNCGGGYTAYSWSKE